MLFTKPLVKYGIRSMTCAKATPPSTPPTIISRKPPRSGARPRPNRTTGTEHTSSSAHHTMSPPKKRSSSRTFSIMIGCSASTAIGRSLR